MHTVTFIKAFTLDVDAATKLTYPEGWTGPVDEDIAAMAAEEGCIEAAPADDAQADDAPSTPAKGKAKAAEADTPPA